MKEVFGDAFSLMKDFDILCITSNGTIRRDGACVMGRGIALEICKRVPRTQFILGELIRKNGNHVHRIFTTKKGRDVVSFPVKHNWFEHADIELIKRSCKELVEYAQGRKVLLPRPGCGNGKLSWIDVKPIIEQLLPDNVYIVHWSEEK